MAAELSDAEQRAIVILARSGPTTCANLGSALWGDRPVGSNCSCPWARPAGALLKRLLKRGIVRRVPDKHHTLYGLDRRKGFCVDPGNLTGNASPEGPGTEDRPFSSFAALKAHLSKGGS